MPSNYRNFGGSLYWAKSLLSKIFQSPNLFMRRPIFGNLEDGCHSRKSLAASRSQFMFRLNSQRNSTQTVNQADYAVFVKSDRQTVFAVFKILRVVTGTLKGKQLCQIYVSKFVLNFLYYCRRNKKAIRERSF